MVCLLVMSMVGLTLMDKIGQGDSDIIFADLDHDGDGKINFEDFRSVVRSLSNFGIGCWSSP